MLLERKHSSPMILDKISFMGANYVAKQVGYHMIHSWRQGQDATNRHFQPLATFPKRFEDLLKDIRALGFTTLDIWTAQLNWAWVTPEHLHVASQLLRQYQMRVASIAGSFGATREDLEAACRVARALDTKVLVGMGSIVLTERREAVAILKQNGVRVGIENHAEKTPQEMLLKIGNDSDGTIGTAIDTGWYATQRYDAVRAIEELYPYLVAVHLKDIRTPGTHETCRYGQGCVNIEACVATLKRLGYSGTYSIEHEPEFFDPTEDCKVMFSQLQTWLS